MAEAVDHVVVDHADRLHERVADGRPAELEAPLLERLRHRTRFGRLGRDLGERAPTIEDGLALDELPEKARSAARLDHEIEIRPRRCDGAFDLGAIAHDAGIGQQRRDLVRVVGGDLRRLEPVERPAEVVALPEDRDPGQTGLKALEDQHLEQRALVAQRHAPFLVVIGDVERIAAGPAAAHDVVVDQSLLPEIFRRAGLSGNPPVAARLGGTGGFASRVRLINCCAKLTTSARGPDRAWGESAPSQHRNRR